MTQVCPFHGCIVLHFRFEVHVHLFSDTRMNPVHTIVSQTVTSWVRQLKIILPFYTYSGLWWFLKGRGGFGIKGHWIIKASESVGLTKAK